MKDVVVSEYWRGVGVWFEGERVGGLKEFGVEEE